MKIVHLITRSDEIGGAQIYVLHLAKEQILRGHEVEVWAGGDGLLFEMLGEAKIPSRKILHMVREIRPIKDIKAAFLIFRTLLRCRPDVFALHSSKAGWLGRLAAAFLRVPVVFTAHGWSFAEGVSARRRRIFRFLERLYSPMADKIIAVSEHDRELAIRLGVTAPNRIITVHNGIPESSDLEVADPSVNPPKLIMIARFAEQKDHSLLLKALSSIKRLSWSLDLVGDGPLRQLLAEECRVLGLEDRVRFLGERRDIDTLLANSQLFVLASRWEGFPLSILEAMRAGLPVVASDVGGIREAVNGDVTGMLVASRDVHLLAAALQELIENPELRKLMGYTARKVYEQQFTLEMMADRVMDVYEVTLGNHPKSEKKAVASNSLEA